MNLKPILTTLAFTLAVIAFSFAQNGKPQYLKVKASEEIKTGKKEHVSEIIGKDENGMYVMATYGNQITMFYYLNDLTLKKKTTVELELNKKALVYRGVLQMGDEITLFSSFRDKKKKMTYLYSHILNKSTLLYGNPKKIAEESYEGYKKRESAEFSFTTSADSNYLMFVTDLPSGKEDVDRFGLIVYDKNMEEVWSHKKIEMDETDIEFERYSAQVGVDGKVYLLAKIYDTSIKYKRGEVNYTFQMHVFDEESEGEEPFNVGLKDQFMSDVSFERLDNGDIHVIGFYSERSGTQNGVFNLLVDGESNEVINEETTEFPTGFIVQHSSEKAKKKAKKKEAKGKEIAFYSFEIDDVIEHKNGSLTMVGEQFRFYVTCSTDANGNQHCTNHYVYGNIIVVNFNENGEVEWMELIPKYQHTTNDHGYYSGYALVTLPDGSLNFIFNDNPKNSFYDTSGKIYRWKRTPKNTDVVMVVLEESGKMDRHVLLKGGDEEVMSRPVISTQIGQSEMIVLGEAKKKSKFYKLLFDKE
jgi:hypothetical protein